MKRGERGRRERREGGTKTLDKRAAKTRASRYLRCHSKGLSLRVQGRLKLPFPRSRPPIAAFADPIRRPNPELGSGVRLRPSQISRAQRYHASSRTTYSTLEYYMYGYRCYFLETEQSHMANSRREPQIPSWVQKRGVHMRAGEPQGDDLAACILMTEHYVNFCYWWI